MRHHGGKLGRGKVDLRATQNAIADVTAKSKALEAKKDKKPSTKAMESWAKAKCSVCGGHGGGHNYKHK